MQVSEGSAGTASKLAALMPPAEMKSLMLVQLSKSEITDKLVPGEHQFPFS